MSTSLEEIVAVDLSKAVDWEAFDIPGGSCPVSVCRLHADPATRSVTLAVRFPAGWERAESGSYDSSEEIYVVEGVLEMNGLRHPAGTWIRVPGGAVRERTATPEGAVAVARFDGPARWRSERAKP